MNDTINIRLDTTDLLILQLLYDQEYTEEGKQKPLLSLQEINSSVLSVRSIASIHGRVMRMQEAGLITSPPRKVPRSRRITQKGIERLKNELYGTGSFTYVS